MKARTKANRGRLYLGALALYGGSAAIMVVLLGWLARNHPVVVGAGLALGVVVVAAVVLESWTARRRERGRDALIQAAWQEMGAEKRGAPAPDGEALAPPCGEEAS